MPGLTQRYQRALNDSFFLHGADERKGDKTPYYAHLMAVSSLVLEHGGDEDTAIAALFHDTLEDKQDARGWVTAYGEKVTRIVEECSDTQVQPKPEWRTRKEQHLAEIPHKSKEALLVLAADKLHNLRSLFLAFAEHGDVVFDWFRGGKEGTLWYFQSMAQALYDNTTDTWITVLLLQEVDAFLLYVEDQSVE
jgi:(p)ppGpp synthase/HD superfamily hydrolase